jgi:hypothetical protein
MMRGSMAAVLCVLAASLAIQAKGQVERSGDGDVVRMTAPQGTQQIGAGALIVVPAGTAITVQAFGPEMGALAEFVPARR